ncbi:hypothetical protein L2E82_14069 [Cichorium intybus]|uniref:Uncharacterized protein n=1 Tax=Cichorium intybus TaxID=13427 RepID=A0ACB9EYN9_CICIN|nr:hypothetical protein L2E82_14069 [Cichorium intybus]
MNDNIHNILTEIVSAVKPESLAETDTEKIIDWLYAAAPYLIAAAVFWISWVCCCRCLCGRRRSTGTMNAPGRRSTRLPRAAFERNPRGIGKGEKSSEVSDSAVMVQQQLHNGPNLIKVGPNFGENADKNERACL